MCQFKTVDVGETACPVSRLTSSLDPFLGEKGTINLKFTGQLENSLMKLLTNYQPAKLTRLGLI